MEINPGSTQGLTHTDGMGVIEGDQLRDLDLDRILIRVFKEIGVSYMNYS
jgi:hypothetical protein